MADGELDEMMDEFSDGRVSYGCTPQSLLLWAGWLICSCPRGRSKHQTQQIRSHRMGNNHLLSFIR